MAIPAPTARRRDQFESLSDMPSPDEVVWARVGTGEREWNTLVAMHLQVLRAAAQRLCRNDFDSDDIVQVTMLHAMRAHHQLRDQTRMLPWLLTILRRAFCDESRRRGRLRSVSFDDNHEVAVEQIEALPWEQVTDDDLCAAIVELPDDVRDTYRLFAVERRPYSEISRLLGIPERTIGTRIHRARKRLRELLWRVSIRTT